MLPVPADSLDSPVWTAAIGPLSSLLETLATTVGAGLVLGTFVAGATGLVEPRRPTRRQLEDAGYFGGLAAIGFFLLDASVLVVR